MAYEVHLKEFDGPLDLLLHLIEQAKVDIRDIFVSEITNEYLSLMRDVDSLDMDTASEFLTMAATLVYIKSRSLLPRPPRDEQEEGEDPEEQLIRQLRDYKLFKEAGEKLDALKRAMESVYRRLPEEFVLPPQEYDIKQATLEELTGAFFSLLHSKREGGEIPELAQSVRADTFTVREKLSKIRALLRERETLEFEELFDEGAEKIEMIVTFMALLEMIARQEIRLSQSSPYGKITLRAGKLATDDENYEYMDEYDS